MKPGMWRCGSGAIVTPGEKRTGETMAMQKCSTCGKSCRRTLNICPTCFPPPKRLIGSTWTDSKGRTWEVTEMVNPGLYRVCVFKETANGGRVAIRVGESYVRNIRAAIAASKGGA